MATGASIVEPPKDSKRDATIHVRLLIMRIGIVLPENLFVRTGDAIQTELLSSGPVLKLSEFVSVARDYYRFTNSFS
jgi:hypothetical protein